MGSKFRSGVHRIKQALKTTYLRGSNLPWLILGVYRGYSNDLGLSFEHMVVPLTEFSPANETLRFNPDFLPDRATWSGADFLNSPHVRFARSYLANPGMTFNSTEYYKLGIRGRLPFPTFGRSMSKRCRDFCRLIDSIRDNGYDPRRFGAIALIRCTDGTVMVLNGKHRLAALLALNVPTFEVTFCFANEVEAAYRGLARKSWPAGCFKTSMMALRTMGTLNTDAGDDVLAIKAKLLSHPLETKTPIYHPLPFYEFRDLPTQVQADTPYRRLALILNQFDTLEGKTVLDLGCNIGFYSYSLAKRGANVTSVEIREAYTEIIRSLSQYYKLPITVVNQPVTRELLESQHTYDVTLCFSMLQWVIAQEGFTYGAELLRLISNRSRTLFFDISVNEGKASLSAPRGQELQYVFQLLREHTCYEHIEHVGDVHPYKTDTRHVFYCH